MSISHVWQDAKDGVARKRGLRLNFSGHSEKLEMLSFTVRLDFLGVFHRSLIQSLMLETDTN